MALFAKIGEVNGVNILDVIVKCQKCGDEALAIDSIDTDDGLKCRFCGSSIEVKQDTANQSLNIDDPSDH